MSVSNHSESNKNYVIYSTFNNRVKDLDTFMGHVDFLKIGEERHKVLLGYYKGQEEYSIIRPYKKYIIEAALDPDKFNQDCVLVLKNHKHGLYKAYFVYKDMKEVFQGYLREVPEEIAIKQDSHTKDGNNYYIITKSDTVLVDEVKKLYKGL